VTAHNPADGGNLTYTVSGERLTPGAVSCISYILMDCAKVVSYSMQDDATVSEQDEV
jgi:hypothetical protein